uniref:Uncharacterized protein n=1 Tax=Arundo donax TaxID=35708 RepID=A0A0A9A3P0_ARUDO
MATPIKPKRKSDYDCMITKIYLKDASVNMVVQQQHNQSEVIDKFLQEAGLTKE